MFTGDDTMKIVMLEGSPHKTGTTKQLAIQFRKGAEEAGHIVEELDIGNADIKPCMSCGNCSMTGNCVTEDDIIYLKDKILSCDMLVFVTPVFYYGMTAQLKTLIDRFYSFNTELVGKKLKSCLLAAAFDENPKTIEPLKAHYSSLCEYLGFKDKGSVLAYGCGTPSMMQWTDFPKKAYELGKSLRQIP